MFRRHCFSISSISCLRGPINYNFVIGRCVRKTLDALIRFRLVARLRWTGWEVRMCFTLNDGKFLSSPTSNLHFTQHLGKLRAARTMNKTISPLVSTSSSPFSQNLNCLFILRMESTLSRFTDGRAEMAWHNRISRLTKIDKSLILGSRILRRKIHEWKRLFRVWVCECDGGNFPQTFFLILMDRDENSRSAIHISFRLNYVNESI